MAAAFDVFFSYSTRDHVAVERVVCALTDCGLRIFLDRWYLTPGQPWPQALEETLAACNAVVVFIGAEGLGPWQQRERDLALDRQAREPGFPLIPVLLSRGDPALGFLKLNTWVDLSGGAADPEALSILTAAIRGEPPGPLARQRSEAARAAVCPYRGLRPFREEDEPFFFGRDSFAETLTATVLRQPFVAVVGASGSGKSSVVRAGLIPRLRRGAGDRVWDALTLVPTDRPLTSLAAALLPALEPDLDEIDRLAKVNKLAAHLADGKIGLRDVAARVLAKQSGTDRLLLFVDQWEELYTLCADDAVRRTFVGQLLHAADDRLCVVATIRGDFMGRALDNRGLADRLQDAVVTIGPMTRGELKETIVEPATKIGLSFEEGLPGTILDDVGDEPGGLPLLELLLEGLWQERRGSALTLDAYDRLGRVSGAIAHRAEEVFEHSLNEAERLAAHRLLIRMVRPGEGVVDTRRRTAMPASDAVADTTIQKLAKERLLVTERDAGSGDVTVNLAHEALIRRWQRLRDWINADREFLRTRERIATQAQLWEEEKRSADRLLPPGRPLAEGEDLLAKRRADLEPMLVEYIEASAAAMRASERRKRLRTHAFVSAMAVIAVVALCFGGLAWWQRGEAHRNAEQAHRNADQAQLQESRAQVSLAEVAAAEGFPAAAMRVALAAVPRNLAAPDRAYVVQAEGEIWNILQSLHELRRLSGCWGCSIAFSPDSKFLAIVPYDQSVRLWEVATGKIVIFGSAGTEARDPFAFSPDGRLLATGSEDKTVRLWEVATGKEIATLRGHEGRGSSFHFSPDGRLLATGSEDKTVRLWEVATGKEINAFPGDRGDKGEMIAFSPDGKLLATAFGNTARLWEVATGKEIAVFRGHEGLVDSAAFSPDGRLLATGSADKTARVWEVATGNEIATFAGHEGEVHYVRFIPDGRFLVTGSLSTVRFWEVATRTNLYTFHAQKGEVSSVTLTRDGRLLATSSYENTTRLWEATDGKEIVDLRDQAPVNHVVVSPDGKLLATESDDSHRAIKLSVDYGVRLWQVGTQAEATPELGVPSGQQAVVLSVAFSPDGRLLATGSHQHDNTARLWEVATGREIAILHGHKDYVRSIAFSPDGKLLATGSDDNTARLWEVATGKEIAALRGHGGRVTSVAFSPDGKLLATGSFDETARVWEVATGKEIAAFRGDVGLVYSLSFSPDGKLLATGSDDNPRGSGDYRARLWEVATGKQVMALGGHGGRVTSVAFSPDGKLLATGSDDNRPRLWEVATGRQIVALPDAEPTFSANEDITAISFMFTRDGRFLATGSRYGTARLWPVGQGLIDLACARVHNLPLSEQDKQRFGIEKEWCTPEVSAALRAKLGLDTSSAEPAPADPATDSAH